MRSLLIAFATTICLASLVAQENRNRAKPLSVSNWLSVAASKLPEKYWESANLSDVEWSIGIEDGRVVARRDAKGDSSASLPFVINSNSPGQRGRRHLIKTTDGWLIGWNAGEWGGSVWWFSSDGSNSNRISKHQVVGFYPVADGILAPSGLAHLGISEGKLVKFTKTNDQWTSKEVVDLKAAPEAACLDKDSTLIIATTENLVRVKSSGELTVILPKVSWGLLYPNSMVIDTRGDAWIGMRQGVVKVEKAGKSARAWWFVPDKSYLEVKPRN